MNKWITYTIIYRIPQRYQKGQRDMLENIFDLMIEGHSIEDLTIDGQQLFNPERNEEMQIADIIKAGSQADPAEYDRRMGLAAGCLDAYMEKIREFGVASGLSAEYEYEARLNGFIMGFKAALQLMNINNEVGK